MGEGTPFARGGGAPGSFDAALAAAWTRLAPKIVGWRRDIHAHPELSNREHRTGALVADHLRALGFDEVKANVAHTGVVGVLKGGKPGRVVALRADMDGLPVSEEVDVPFKSTATAPWNGQTVGVMHACGHDAHTAILMGIAEAFAEMRAEIPGTVKFFFQPAEESPPMGEDGGARMMIAEGALEDPKVEAIFGLHVWAGLPVGQVRYRSGPLMASADDFHIHVTGKQTHAALPWRGVDPIVAAAQIVTGLQTVVSRKMNITKEPSIVTVGVFRGGVRPNIIPDEAKLEGTIRAFDEAQRNEIHAHVRHVAEKIAESAGATARVHIHRWYDVTVNHAELTSFAAPVLERIAGREAVAVGDKVCGAEDFSFFQQKVPGFFYFIGCTRPDIDAASAAPNHSPRFEVDEACLETGVRTLGGLALSWLSESSRSGQ
jgi:amidohydrolase